MYTKKGLDRLEKLADFLEKEVKPTWFNLDEWGSPGFTQKKCGSTACAFGWATQIWPRHLKLDEKPYDPDCPLSWNPSDVVHKKTGKKNYEAANAFFNISYSDTSYLFYPRAYPATNRGRLYVAKRIRSFVKSRRKYVS